MVEKVAAGWAATVVQAEEAAVEVEEAAVEVEVAAVPVEAAVEEVEEVAVRPAGAEPVAARSDGSGQSEPC